MGLHDDRGASAVEFAIIASLLLVILFGAIQFGIIFNRYQGVQAAGREGARLGSLSGTTRQQIVQRVADSLSIVNPANLDDPCPGGTTPALSVDRWCVRLWERPAPGEALQPHDTPGPGPCSSSGGSKSVVVQVFYRTTLDIPLWASPQMTLGGTGEFRCE